MELRPIRWCIRWWNDEGVPRDERGTDFVEVAGDWPATIAVADRLLARLKRPFRIAFGDTLEHGIYWGVTYPAGFPDRHALRARVLAGMSPGQLRAELRATGATWIAINVAFGRAFELEPDATTDEDIARQQEIWERPHQLREAYAGGVSLVDTLHHQKATSSGVIPLFKALRDAFDLAFNDAKILLDLACHRDPSFDEMFEQALARALAARARE